MEYRQYLTLLTIITALLAAKLGHAQTDNIDNLRGMSGLFWNVNTAQVSGLNSSERMDLNDIVELQLRRGAITLKPYILNQPDQNVPLLEISIAINSHTGPDQIEVSLRVFDHATIERNQQRTIAKTYELVRTKSVTKSSEAVEIIKAELREIMTEFVNIYKQANP